MTETSGENGQKERRVYSSRTWGTMLGVIAIATWLRYEDLIEGPGWITVVLALFAGWQSRRYAEDKLQIGGK